MRNPKHPRQFAEEFRRQIVALVDSGKPRAEVMREHDLGKSTPDRWIRRVHACGPPPPRTTGRPSGTASSSRSGRTPASGRMSTRRSRPSESRGRPRAPATPATTRLSSRRAGCSSASWCAGGRSRRMSRPRTGLFDWVNRYDNCRLHSTLGYMTPAGFREAGLILS